MWNRLIVRFPPSTPSYLVSPVDMVSLGVRRPASISFDGLIARKFSQILDTPLWESFRSPPNRYPNPPGRYPNAPNALFGQYGWQPKGSICKQSEQLKYRRRPCVARKVPVAIMIFYREGCQKMHLQFRWFLSQGKSQPLICVVTCTYVVLQEFAQTRGEDGCNDKHAEFIGMLGQSADEVEWGVKAVYGWKQGNIPLRFVNDEIRSGWSKDIQGKVYSLSSNANRYAVIQVLRL